MMSPRDDAFRPCSDFLRTLAERGFIHQCTDLAALDMRLCAGTVATYNGFDLTADSLRVGHLIPIMMLRWFQRTGHKPIVLMGGGTTRVGDPSFRDTTRPLLDDGELRIVEIYLAALQSAQPGLTNPGEQRECKDVMKVLAQCIDEGGLFGLAHFALRDLLRGDAELQIRLDEGLSFRPD